MKISDMITDLKKHIDVAGDQFVLSYKYVTETESSERYKTSPTRKSKFGSRAKMNQKEFKEWCEKQKQKSST